MPVATHIPGRLASVAEVQRQIPGNENGYGGFVTQAAMRLELENTDGQLDELPDFYQWRDRRIQLFAGLTTRGPSGREIPPPLADFIHQYDGRCVNLEVGRNQLTVTVEEGVKRLDRPIQENLYLGQGGSTGGPGLAGLPIPLTYGPCRQITPTFIDQLLLIAQVHETEVKSIFVYDRGVALTFINNMATYAELEALVAFSGEEGPAADLHPGEYATCLAVGCFRLGGQPVGIVTADVDGDGRASGAPVWDGNAVWNGGAQWDAQGTVSHARYLGAVVSRVLGRVGFDSSEISPANDQFDVLYPFEVGLHVPSSQRSTARELLTTLVTGVGAVITRNRIGEMLLLALEEPAPSPKIIINSGMIARDGIERIALPYGAAWAKIRLQYNLNWSPMQADSIEATVSGDAKDFLLRPASFVEKVNDETAAVLPDRPPLIIESLLRFENDANMVAGRLLRVYSKARQLYNVRVHGINFILELLDTVQISYPRYGLNDGRNMLVMRIIERPGQYETELHLFG